ncbi:MAG: SCO family protein [Sphingomonadaceae bacterium]|nr:SCO family protein [Sphingomonadaceae bacterium]
MLRSIYSFSLVAAAALALASCGGAAPPGPSADGVDLRGAAMGGDFTLTGNKGQKVSWSDFDGKYRIVYFGFTYCPDICPTDLGRMSKGLEQFEKAHPALGAKIQPIFISVDPGRDTPQVLDEFVGNFHRRLIGLTGSEAEITAILPLFGATASKDEPNEEGGYNVTHTTFTYLFDQQGKPLGILPTDKGSEAVAKELEGWVR